jgi:RadC-like JAB domain
VSEEITTIYGPEDVVAFLRACEVPTTDRAQIVLGLTLTEAEPLAHVVCGAAVRSGAEAEQILDASQLIALAEELVVCALVIATVEPDGPRLPARSDTQRFVRLRRTCADDGVVLLDWVVVNGNHWYSFREQIIHEAA